MIAVFFSTIMFSQEDETTNNVVNKKGIAILPQAGDFAIGIDASPVFNLVGNMVRINDFTGPFSDPMSFNFVQGNSIYGKYFLTDNSAVRVRFDINSMSRTDEKYVTDDTDTINFTAKVLDSRKMSGSGVNLGIGYEMRRGKGRLQAFYGGELNLSLGGGLKSEYTYGNSFSNDSTPSYFNWNTMSENTLAIDQHRVVNSTVAGGFGLGLRAFVGVEYFLFPNIAVGGEFGWGFGMNSAGEGETNTEFWSGTDYMLDTFNSKSAGSSGFNVGTDNLGGQVYLLFHF